jgi:glutamate dehydrogenase/leucine dehydrogenase
MDIIKNRRNLKTDIKVSFERGEITGTEENTADIKILYYEYGGNKGIIIINFSVKELKEMQEAIEAFITERENCIVKSKQIEDFISNLEKDV